MAYQRIRVRFRKEGDLRLISHRDLVRAFERLFRRVGAGLRMSEGFHPKARMTFPSALALGIAALDEVMETELTEPVEVEDFADRLRAQAPAGLVITQVVALESGERKARVQRFTYEFPVPEPRRAGVRAAIERLLAQDRWLVERDGRSEPVDVRGGLLGLELAGGTVCFALGATDEVTVRPREVLTALGLADLERDGLFLTRTGVELTT